MNAKHRKTLAAIFGKPTPKTLPFRDIEAMLKAVGCKVLEAEGSRVGFACGAEMWTTHRPHPGKEAYAIHIRGVRDFLKKIGVTP